MKTVTQKGRHSTHKSKIRRVLKKWDNKVMHGQYIGSMDRQLIGEEESFQWLSRRNMKGETESEIIAAQDQAFFFLWRCDPTRVMASSFSRFLDHTQRRTTIGRTPLDE